MVMAAIAPGYPIRAMAAAYSNSTEPQPQPDHPEKELRNWSSLIGIITAIVGNILIALALNVQRYAHIRLHRERARVKERAKLVERREALSQYGTSHYGAVYNNNNGPSRPADPGATPGYFDRHDGTQAHNGRSHSPGLASSGNKDGEEAQDTTDSYLRSPYWWLGQVLISLGEMGNFLAYGFAPASIVSPLGVVALISNCVIAPMLFKEKFRQRDFLGVVIAVAGVVTVVLSANQQETKLDPHDVWDAITSLEFELYLGVTIFLIICLMWTSATCADRTILVDLGLVGLFGGYTALATKGVSSMLSSTLWRAFATPVTYALIFVLLATAIMQIRYVNKALQRSDSTVVIPIQFVTFTLCVIIGSAVLYRDFEHTTARQAVKFVGGCLLTFFGVFLITSGRMSTDDGDDDLDDDAYLVVDDADEAIGLLYQDNPANPHPQEAAHGDSVQSHASSRSSPPSRISLSGALTQPFVFQREPGVPRAPQHEAGAGLSPTSDVVHAGFNPWSALETDGTAAASYNARSSPSTESGPATIARQNSAALDLLLAEPSMMARSVGSNPLQFASEPQLPTTTTSPHKPAAAAGKTHGRHLSGPLISPSPLSSTVSAVVKDTLRRHGDNPMRHKSSLGRLRSSIRASLFISDDDDDNNDDSDGGERRRRHSRPSRGEPLLCDLADVEEGDLLGGAAAGDATGRTRSLSDTLGDLFRPRRGRGREEVHDAHVEGGDAGGAAAAAAGPDCDAR